MLFASYLGVAAERGACPFFRETRAIVQLPVQWAVYLDTDWPMRSIRNLCDSETPEATRWGRRRLPCRQTNARITALHFADPLPVFPNRFKRREVAAVKDVSRRTAKPALLQIVPGVARADGDKLQHARIAIAIDHTARATVADQLRL